MPLHNNKSNEIKIERDTVVNKDTMSVATTTTSILNGIVGDYLEASENELATKMAFYRNGLPLPLSEVKKELHESNNGDQQHRRRIVILLHGLVNDESAWQFQDGSGDYGQFLQRDLEKLTPLYLRYNTGLHVSENGRKFDKLMQDLMQSLGDKSYEVVLICHSMGGLVARSATHHAMSNANTHSWVHQLSSVIFLGTPHQGSYWERAGNVVSSAMHAVPRPYMKLAAKVANLRSSGIQDLRYGYVLDEDWVGEDSSAFLTNTKKGNEAMLDWVTYHVVTGTVTKDPNHTLSRVFGDALVTKASAHGHSESEEHHLDFSSQRSTMENESSTTEEIPTLPLIREFPGVHHTVLQCNREVYLQIKEWVRMAAAPPPPCDRQAMNLAPDEVPEVDDMPSVEDDQADATSPTTVGKCRGAVSLVQDAVHAGATAVEGVQTELTDEVYHILGKVKPIAPVVHGVHAIHTSIAAGIYGMIRGINYGVGESTKCALDHLGAANEALDAIPSQI